ncbi:ABC transporter substrate-binding protein [Halomicrobium salinisoli]|uniref:ABC transporter substrate-binding protein n=1 Tax=Halomicrobium salinisoli TaxID=2878391 RepID=UPI001CEFB291|nr:ABC transporter substrate-binding protein [Halomicrobium salinisoli]
MAEQSDNDGYDSAISRRKLLAVAGASGAAALAGCSGDSSDGAESTDTTTTTTTSTGDSIQVHDAAYTASFTGNPNDLHFNSASRQNYSWPAGRCVFAPFMKYSFTEGEFLMGALEDIEINTDDQEAVLTFRDDLQWDDGDPVTTEDIDVKFQLAEKTETALMGYIDDWEVVDEQTIRLDLAGPTNPEVLKYSLATQRVDRKRDIHDRFLDADATEFLQWEWDGEETDVVSSAMWSFDSKGRQAFTFERNEDFYKAENVNFSEFVIESFGGNNAQHQALMSADNVDGAFSLFVPPEIVDQFPDHVEEIMTPSKWGYGMVFNHDNEHYGKRPVRQAIAHAINRSQLVENAGPRTKFTPQVPCGIMPEDQEPWLGDWMSDFEDYGPESSNTDRAAELMQEAGYARNGDGFWEDDSGNVVGGEYHSPAGWTDWTTMSQTVVSQLQDFGFDLSVSTKPVNNWFSTYSDSNFALGSFPWSPGQARSAFPYFPMRYQLQANDIAGGHNYREKAQSEQTIPARGGGEMTITPLEEVEKIPSQPDRESARPYVQRVAWHNNIELPMLGLESSFSQTFTTTDDWTVASEGDPDRGVNRAQHWQVHEGKLQHKN